MKKQLSVLFLTFGIASLALVACKKDKGGDDAGSNNQIAIHSDDQNLFSSDIDAVADDANIALEGSGTFAQRPTDVEDLICNSTVAVDSTSAVRTITITYNGANCIGNRTRTGTVVISVPQGVRWKDAGAQLTVSFQNLKITRVSDNKSITINGQQTYTNVSGGLIVSLALQNTITHTITSDNMAVKFDDNTTRTWHVAKRRVFSYDNGVVITTSGTHTDGLRENVAEWGTTRFGQEFSNSTIFPVVVRQDCAFRITGGWVNQVTPLYNAAVQFGLNANGQPTSCPGSASYYSKVTWVNMRGDTTSVLIPY